MSSANLVALRFIQESVLGTTPANPALTSLRFLSESLNYAIQNTVSEEIRSDRAQTDTVPVSAEAAGDINFELSFATFDAWLQALLGGTWGAVSGNIQALTNGTTVRSFTVQKDFSDLISGRYHTFRGVIPNKMTLGFEIGQIVKGSFGCLAMSAAMADAQISGATFVAAPTNTPMNAVSNFQAFMVDSVPYSGCISALSLEINNNFRAIRCLGNLASSDMKSGTLEITGSMDLYFNEGSLYSKFLAGQEFDFSFRMMDAAGNNYTFYVPRAKFETGEVVAGGLNTDVMLRTTWRALYDGTAGHVIRIVKDPIG